MVCAGMTQIMCKMQSGDADDEKAVNPEWYAV